MLKVTQEIDERKGHRILKFECNTDQDVDTLDTIRTAMFGNHSKIWEYVDSRTLVIKVLDEEIKTP